MGIEEARIAAGLTRIEMAKKFNIPIRTLENWDKKTNKAPKYVEALIIEKLEEMNMKINGIGTLRKNEIMSVLTTEGKQAVKDGDMTMEEAADIYKLEMIKRASKIGKYGDTFNACYKRIPEELFEKLSPKELAELVDAFYTCYGEGKNN